MQKQHSFCKLFEIIIDIAFQKAIILRKCQTNWFTVF